MKFLKPKHWFAAHLHCKFSALVKHDDDKITKFLALDKCLPGKRFLQILDIETEDISDSIRMEYDLEWLTILNSTNHLLSVKQSNNYMPGPNSKERFEFTPTEEELDETRKKFIEGLTVPKNFTAIVKPYNPHSSYDQSQGQPKSLINPQTSQFCEQLQIDDPLVLAMSQSGLELNYSDISLNLSSASEANTTFNNSNVTDGDFSTPLKRKSLSLPDPSFENDSNADVVILEEIIHTEESAVCPSKTVKRDLENDVILNKEPICSPPKFKRRNANIYESTDE